jgi:hypothetical protein
MLYDCIFPLFIVINIVKFYQLYYNTIIYLKYRSQKNYRLAFKIIHLTTLNVIL